MVGWTEREDLESYGVKVFESPKGTRAIIQRDCTPNGMYSLICRYKDGAGIQLATRCKYSTACAKAKKFDAEM